MVPESMRNPDVLHSLCQWVSDLFLTVGRYAVIDQYAIVITSLCLFSRRRPWNSACEAPMQLKRDVDDVIQGRMSVRTGYGITSVDAGFVSRRGYLKSR